MKNIRLKKVRQYSRYTRMGWNEYHLQVKFIFWRTLAVFKDNSTAIWTYNSIIKNQTS